MPDQRNGTFQRTLKALQNVYFVWAVLLIDVALLLWAMVVRPQVFEYTWAKILVLVAAVKAVLVFLGIVENERLKNPYTNLNEFLLNPFSWSAVLLFSALFWAAIIDLGFNPPAISITLNVAGYSKQLHPADCPTGFLVVQKDGGTDIFTQRVPLDTTIDVSYIDVYSGYSIIIMPADSDAYGKEKERTVTDFGTKKVGLQVHPKKYLARFVLTPIDAKISVSGTPVVSRLAELTKGTYRYEVTAPNFMTDTGTFNVPDQLVEPYKTFTVQLKSKTVQTVFYADRGIGKKIIPIDGMVTIKEGESIFMDSVRTGASIAIPVGRSFTAEVLARGTWDLSSRTYRGDTLFVVKDSLKYREVWIKVVEQL